MHTLWKVNEGHSAEMPEELRGVPFEARYRNGQTARYPISGKARWDFHTNSTTPFDIVAYRFIV